VVLDSEPAHILRTKVRKLDKRCALRAIDAPGLQLVRGGVEPPTFRFSEGLLPLWPPWIVNRVSPAYLHNSWSELTRLILAAVPPSAG
jgi:hypothetical protein